MKSKQKPHLKRFIFGNGELGWQCIFRDITGFGRTIEQAYNDYCANYRFMEL